MQNGGLPGLQGQTAKVQAMNEALRPEVVLVQ